MRVAGVVEAAGVVETGHVSILALAFHCILARVCVTLFALQSPFVPPAFAFLAAPTVPTATTTTTSSSRTTPSTHTTSTQSFLPCQVLEELSNSYRPLSFTLKEQPWFLRSQILIEIES